MGGMCGKGGGGGATGEPKRSDKNTIKVLILGVSGCGKSTFAKQMKILHTEGFQDFEVNNYKSIIQRNVVSGIREISIYILEHRDDYNFTEEQIEAFQFFQESTNVELKGEVIEKVSELWNFEQVRDVYEQVKFMFHHPHLDYYMEHLERVSEESFVPLNEDIVRCRQATIGASTITFWRDRFWWSIVDVGGHKPERAKWENIVRDGINAMVYFVALDDFISDSGEEKDKSKMDVSKLVWDEIINSDKFDRECTLLFLNKCDVFKEQIQNDNMYKEFKKSFPEYNGEQNYDQAVEHVKQEFLDLSKRIEPNKIFTHITCAIDTEQMNVVWEALKTSIINKRLEASGLPPL